MQMCMQNPKHLSLLCLVGWKGNGCWTGLLFPTHLLWLLPSSLCLVPALPKLSKSIYPKTWASTVCLSWGWISKFFHSWTRNESAMSHVLLENGYPLYFLLGICVQGDRNHQLSCNKTFVFICWKKALMPRVSVVLYKGLNHLII